MALSGEVDHNAPDVPTSGCRIDRHRPYPPGELSTHSVEVATGVGETSEGGVWLSVSDQGAGIPADKRAHIFDLFFTTKKTGTGFGLATVRKIVDRHAGKIVVDTASVGDGLGTRFRVWLPPA